MKAGDEMGPLWSGRWLEHEIPYIVGDDERDAFKKLSTDDERDAFIESFWERRNPNPASHENAYKGEYYRRIAYANERYGCAVPGWKTDRGRIYIMYGPPDEIESNPIGGTSAHPIEQWRYRNLEGIGTNIVLDFSDSASSREYPLIGDPGYKDILLRTLPYAIAFHRSLGSQVAPDGKVGITRLDVYTGAFQPPPVKFRDLKAVITSKLSAHFLPFDMRTDFVRLTDESTLTPVTVQIAINNLEFQNKDGVMHDVVDVYGEIANLSGRIVNIFENSLALDVPEQVFPDYQNHYTVYQEAVPLTPGRYKLNLVLKDEMNGHIGSKAVVIAVPRFNEDNLTCSSLILADQLSPLPLNHDGFSTFVIGATKVRPNVNNTFTSSEKLGIYVQVYNLGIDEKTHKPSLNVRYELERDGKLVLYDLEREGNLQTASQQVTLAKTIPLHGLGLGKILVRVKVTDNIKNQTVSPSATFEVVRPRTADFTLQ
jgi:GWxTD domain-containing protein